MTLVTGFGAVQYPISATLAYVSDQGLEPRSLPRKGKYSNHAFLDALKHTRRPELR
jgi:hypothetical protein